MQLSFSMSTDSAPPPHDEKGECSRRPAFSRVGFFRLALLGGMLITMAQSRSQADEPTATAEKWHAVASDQTDKWEVCRFGGEGDVTFGKDAVLMKAGDPMTGVRLAGEFPKENFEIELEGRRVSGFDFYCGLTFPVGEGHCSLVLGGWSGAVVGLSSIDGEDASANATKRFMTFENGQWYKIKARVDKERVQCWLDGKLIIDQLRGDHKFDIRVEMDVCRPVGIAAYMSDSEFRNFRWRQLP